MIVGFSMVQSPVTDLADLRASAWADGCITKPGYDCLSGGTVWMHYKKSPPQIKELN